MSESRPGIEPRVRTPDLVASATRRLAEAGVDSAAHDARELLGHVTGVSRLQAGLLGEISGEQAERFAALVARRAAREPLQHLTGSVGFRYVELAVGPGVFVPRPETELLAGWAVERARGLRDPVVVDLCTGSGAVALSIAHEVPQARVHAVEIDPAAHEWAGRNLAGSGVDLHLGDMAEALGDLNGEVDVITCNPPYIPLEAWESVAPEVREHDPHAALFSGADGLDAIRVLERVATRLLRPGGYVGAEHADAQGDSAPAVFSSAGRWREVRDHRDLAGRPRFLTAQLAR